MTIAIKCKSKAGHVVTFDVDEIIEIDGKSYIAAPDVDCIANGFEMIAERLDAIEATLLERQQQ
jgi:hypothetical protein